MSVPLTHLFIFCFSNAVWASARRGFRIVSDTVVIINLITSADEAEVM